MESEWTPQMMQLLGIDRRVSADHLGCRLSLWTTRRSGPGTYVLCEINVSSVFPFPEQAPSEIARRARARVLNATDERLTKGCAPSWPARFE